MQDSLNNLVDFILANIMYFISLLLHHCLYHKVNDKQRNEKYSSFINTCKSLSQSSCCPMISGILVRYNLAMPFVLRLSGE